MVKAAGSTQCVVSQSEAERLRFWSETKPEEKSDPTCANVIVYVPGVVAPATVAVSVEEPPALTEPGLNEIVTPEGRPLALRLTLWAAPLSTAVETVDVPFCPCATLMLLGLAEIEKSDAVTVRATVVVWLPLAAVPVTVIE